MKECNLECDLQHEGFCASKEYGFNPESCKAKYDNDLMTEEEYNNSLKHKRG